MSDKRVLDAFEAACKEECKNMGYDWRLYDAELVWRSMAASLADLAHERVHKLFERTKPDFDAWIQQAWPKGIPSECCKLECDTDCLDRKAIKPCRSCLTYKRLTQQFSKHYDH